MVLLVVPSIHCPSCVHRLTTVLTNEYNGIIDNVSVNLLNREIYFDIDNPSVASLKKIKRDVTRTLIDIGYEVETNENDIKTNSQSISQSHLESCDECRKTSTKSHKSKLIRTKLSINGMTCSSCVSTVSDTLKSLPTVVKESVQVYLISSEATFVHEDSLTIDTMEEEISSVGYDIDVIESTSEINQSNLISKFDIKGMSCANCSKTITSSLEEEKDVESVNVSLTEANLIIEHTANLSTNQIMDTVEELGYEAILILSEEKDDKKSNEERSIKIKIDGMFCHKCPENLRSSLNELPLISYSHEFSLDNPVLTLKYQPRTPVFNIRTILLDLSRMHPNFTFSPIESPIGSRSNAIHMTEAKSWALRVLFSGILAIIAIIMSISSTYQRKIRKVLEKNVIGLININMIIMLLISSLCYFIIGYKYHKKSYSSLKGSLRAFKRKEKNGFPYKALFTWGSMDLLVTLGTSIAYWASIVILFINAQSNRGQPVMDFFDMPIFLILFISIGRALESWSKSKTGEAINMLGQLKPKTALLLKNKSIESDDDDDDDENVNDENTALLNDSKRFKEISLSLVEVGDVVLVQPGESVPVDGVMIENISTKFDQSSVTGEAKPVTKVKDDNVFSGTTNLTNAVLIQVTTTGNETLIDRMIRVISESQGKKAPIEKVADIVTGFFVPMIVLISIITLIIWLIIAINVNELNGTTDMDEKILFAVQFGISALVVACPCGIGLATPTAASVASGIAAKIGVLVKGGSESFELLASQVSVVAFDKTGTLTKGELNVADIRKFSDIISDEIIFEVVSQIEENSSHPIAKCIKNYLKSKTRKSVQILDCNEISGRGLQSSFKFNDKVYELRIGNRLFVEIEDLFLHEWKFDGKSIVYIAIKDDKGVWKTTHALAIADIPREESKTVIEKLISKQIEVYMLSGDDESTAKAIARDVGLPEENVIAGILPEEKVKHIELLRSKTQNQKLRPTMYTRAKKWLGLIRNELEDRRSSHSLVMFVGDGLNDAGALAASDVGCALGSGSSISLTAAHFVLLNSSLMTLISIFNLSKLVKRKIIQNFLYACIWNVTLIPIAAGLFYPFFTLPPVYSSIAMAFSSVSVIISSLTLRLHKLN